MTDARTWTIEFEEELYPTWFIATLSALTGLVAVFLAIVTWLV